MLTTFTDESDARGAECRSCGWRGPAGEARLEIKDLDERILPGEECPVAECPQCRCLVHYVKQCERFAEIAWTVGDVQSLFAVDNDEALSFLLEHESDIQELTVARGWEALETLGRKDELPPDTCDEDDDDTE